MAENENLPPEQAPEGETPTPEQQPMENIEVSNLKQNVQIEKNPIEPSDKPAAPAEETLFAAPYTPEEFNQIAESFPRIKLPNDDASRRWAQALQVGAELLMRGNSLMASLLKDEALWAQSVTDDGEQIRAGRPRFENNRDASNRLSGERAIIKARAVMGLGAISAIPLWHTGIWVQIKAPSNAALLELDRRIAEEKVSLGRNTAGMIFSNSSVYINSFLMNFVLNHVYDCSLKDMSIENLKKTIKSTDLPLLVWGMLCTMYMNGYPFSQPCIYNPSKCTHVTNELINVNKLCFTDNNALTKVQKKHMSRRNAKFTPEELARYAEEHRYGQAEMVKLNDHMSIRLKVPSLAEYEESGFAWVDGIEKMVEDSFGVSLRGNERNEYISNQGKMTAIRQYSHWVDRIVLTGGGEEEDIIDDVDTIATLLGELSENTELSTNFFNKMGAYIDRSTISLIAIPKYNCPACGAPQKGEHEAGPTHLIPIDVTQVFFILLGPRLLRTLQQTI